MCVCVCVAHLACVCCHAYTGVVVYKGSQLAMYVHTLLDFEMIFNTAPFSRPISCMSFAAYVHV